VKLANGSHDAFLVEPSLNMPLALPTHKAEQRAQFSATVSP
jgi:hypothetical protein